MHHFRTLLFLVFCVAPGLRLAEAAEIRSAADILPQTTILFVELRHPADFIQSLLTHPVRNRLEHLPPYQEALKSQRYRDFQAIRAIVEGRLDTNWQEALSTLTQRGLVLAADPRQQAVALLASTEDVENRDRLLAGILQLATAEAKRRGGASPVETQEYRGYSVHRTNRLYLAAVEHWLVLTNQREFGKQIVDNFVDKPAEVLATSASFRSAREASGDADAWGFIDLVKIREAGIAKRLFQDKTDNILAEVLLGGLLSSLRITPYGMVRLDLKHDRLKLAWQAPHEAAWSGEAREYYFGRDTGGRSLPPLPVKDSVLSLSTYRDLSQMWLRSGDLLQEDAADQLAKADTTLATLFSGKDFGEQILAAFEPQWQIIVAKQDFAARAVQPAIKLPAFAFHFQMTNAEQVAPELRRIFMSLLGFLNVIGGMNGQPQLDIDLANDEKGSSVIARFVPPPAGSDPHEAPIQYNFSPTVTFSGERCIIASTADLAREIARTERVLTSENSQSNVNTDVRGRLEILRQILLDNRPQLVAQNMLNEGHTKEEAEAEIALLLDILAPFKEISFKMTSESRQLGLQLEILTQSAP